MQDLYVSTLLHVWPMNKCVCDKEVPVSDEYRCYDESPMMWPAVPYGQLKYHHMVLQYSSKGTSSATKG
jgi:hypothetical protein